MLTLLQLQESATAEELLASNGVANVQAQRQVQKARINEQVARNELAKDQAEQSILQSDIAARENTSQGWSKIAHGAAAGAAPTVALVGTAAILGTAVFPGVGTAVGAVVGFLAAAVPAAISAASNFSKQDMYNEATARAEEIAKDTWDLAGASMTAAIEEGDALEVAYAGALRYAQFLTEERILDAEAYAQLVSLAHQISEAYLAEAIRMSWLAQRSLIHDTRRVLRYVRTFYDTEDEISNLTRAQQLTADLELMRGGYVAGETRRRQEIKFTLSLRDLQPGALVELQSSGECVFVLQQEMVDRAFPGLLLHALQDMHLEFVGTLPPDGPRGILSTLGKSNVRVPNDPAYTDGASTSLTPATSSTRAGPADWVVSRLATATGVWAAWNQFVMKEIPSFGISLTLSEFDVRADRAVLQLPQGMLRGVALLGLDNAWHLRLHPQSNAFPFSSLQDVEITFWFLAAYDRKLEDAQAEALRLMAQVDGTFQGTLAASASSHASTMWNAFTRDATSEELLDQRYLSFDRGSYAPGESIYPNKRLTNLYIGTPTDQEIVLRLLSTDDPVGVLVTTRLGAAFTAIGMTWPAGPRQPDAALSTRIQSVFYSGGVPSKAPSPRWVIKLIPAKANPSGGGFEWQAKDADGNLRRTTYGALSSGPTGRMIYLGDAALTHVRLAANVKLNGGTLRFLSRRAGANDEYRLVLSNGATKSIEVFDVAVGVQGTALQSNPLAYPSDEFLYVVFDVYGDATGTTLRVQIDGIEVIKVTDASVTKLSGSVGFDVTAGTVHIDDVRVDKLSKFGVVQSTVVEERFSSTTLPTATWAFTNGVPAWSVATLGHLYASLEKLEDLVLRIDYGFKT